MKCMRFKQIKSYEFSRCSDVLSAVQFLLVDVNTRCPPMIFGANYFLGSRSSCAVSKFYTLPLLLVLREMALMMRRNPSSSIVPGLIVDMASCYFGDRGSMAKSKEVTFASRVEA